MQLLPQIYCLRRSQLHINKPDKTSGVQHLLSVFSASPPPYFRQLMVSVAVVWQGGWCFSIFFPHSFQDVLYGTQLTLYRRSICGNINPPCIHSFSTFCFVAANNRQGRDKPKEHFFFFFFGGFIEGKQGIRLHWLCRTWKDEGKKQSWFSLCSYLTFSCTEVITARSQRPSRYTNWKWQGFKLLLLPLNVEI